MITQQAQIKINLPLALKEFLESKANKFGIPLAGYIKHLMLKDVENMEYPVFEASDKTIKAYKKAMRQKDKAVTFSNIGELDKYLKNL
ncbi:MAG: hypothetical protein PHV63_02570 [Candidatus Daviesbacteria bacterium]|nr:hypothetical protein [Candidatus Daviesbacteria bacterium]